MRCFWQRAAEAYHVLRDLPRVKELSGAELARLQRRMARLGGDSLALPQLVATAARKARARVTHPGKRR